ncbi:hypothetical protein KUV57_13445 [Epibacterium sp. DP7N7-1]|nr:hypothetical protein [Epibacterium sp. DP7N7-1]
MSMVPDSGLEQLEELLAGQLEADPDGILMFPGGEFASDPLNWAAYARRTLGDRVRIYGFWCFENPQASIMGELRERHDFAVIDKRWIVDLWLRRFHSGEGAGVIDMTDEHEFANVRSIYGEPAAWERDFDMESRMDRKVNPENSGAPVGVMTDIDTALDFTT